MKEEFAERIKYTGELDSTSQVVCKEYNLGNFVANNLVLMGYEDFNFILQTTKSKYFVKVFANSRSDDDCKRCVDVVLKAAEAGVSTPKLIKSDKSYLNKFKVNDSELRLCVMDYIEGETFYELKEKLNANEIKVIARQAAMINSLNIKPPFIYDSWSISNFLEEFNKKNKYLSWEDFKLVRPLVEEFEELKIEELPHCFVHGDIISTNVMKDRDSKLWVIDFSVSNYYPRIQELAVLACDLLFNPRNKIESENNLNIALIAYQKKIKLTERELEALPTYIKLAHAMHILCASYARKAQNNSSDENDEYLKKGRDGLEQMLS